MRDPVGINTSSLENRLAIHLRQHSAIAPTARTESPIPQAVTALRDLIISQGQFLDGLSDEQYIARPDGNCSSMGRHTRHALGHIAALLGGIGEGVIDYDTRVRDTDVERCRATAISVGAELSARMISDCADYSDGTIQVIALLSAFGDSIRVQSTLARELVFLLNHTIHHHAMMAAAARALGAAVPDGFGVAPSTVAHERAIPETQLERQHKAI